MRHFRCIFLQFFFYGVISTLTLYLSSCFHNRLVCTWRYQNTIQVVFVYMCSKFDRWDTSVSDKHYSVCDHSTGGSNSAETEEESCKCCATTIFIPQNINFQGQSYTSDSSSNDNSNILEGSGSVYSPEEDNIELGESGTLHEDDSSCTSKDKQWMMINEQWTAQQNKIYFCSCMPTLIGETLQMYFLKGFLLRSHLNTHFILVLVFSQQISLYMEVPKYYTSCICLHVS